jgi:uncharacterized protein
MICAFAPAVLAAEHAAPPAEGPSVTPTAAPTASETPAPLPTAEPTAPPVPTAPEVRSSITAIEIPTPTPTGAPPSPTTPPATPTPACVGKHSCISIEQPIEIASNVWVSSGTERSFVFPLVDSYEGSDVSMPVTVIRGARPGPTLLLTASIHGDEMIGVPIILRLREVLKPEELAGMVVMLPVVNPLGFQRQTRYLPDRRDLNRFFPGNARGSLANRIAHRVFETFVRPADYAIDFHTAAGDRANAPHVRADPRSPARASAPPGFGGVVVLHAAAPGTFRDAATHAGVPTALFEGGEPGRIDERSVEIGVRGVQNVVASLGMSRNGPQNPAPPLWLEYSPWLRADAGGIVELAVGLGDVVQPNQLLLTIRDTLHGERIEMRSPLPGIVMSLAKGPVTQPGNALLRLGIIETQGMAASPWAQGEEEIPE